MQLHVILSLKLRPASPYYINSSRIVVVVYNTQQRTDDVPSILYVTSPKFPESASVATIPVN